MFIFIGSEDKLKNLKAYPQISEDLEEVGRWEFAEVREDGEPSSSSLRTCPISLRIYFF